MNYDWDYVSPLKWAESLKGKTIIDIDLREPGIIRKGYFKIVVEDPVSKKRSIHEIGMGR
jgi:hypothetical protein